MVVAVHETRQERVSGQVDDPCPGRNTDGALGTHRDDAIVLDQDPSIDEGSAPDSIDESRGPNQGRVVGLPKGKSDQ